MSVLKKTIAAAAALAFVSAPLAASAAPARAEAPVSASKANDGRGKFILPLAALIAVALGIAAASGGSKKPKSP